MSTRTPRSSRKTPTSRPTSSVRGGSRPPSSVRGGAKSRAGSKQAEVCSMCGGKDKSLAQLPCKHNYCLNCLKKCPVKEVKEQEKSSRSSKGMFLVRLS